MKILSKTRHNAHTFGHQGAKSLHMILLCLVISLNPAVAGANAFANMFSSMFGMMGSVANMMSIMMSPMSGFGSSGFPMNGLSGYGMPMSSLGGLPMSGLSGLGMPLNTLGLPMNALSAPMSGLQGMPFGGIPGFSGYNGGYGINNSYQQPLNTGPGNFWLNGFWVEESKKVYLQINNRIFQLRTPRGTMAGYATSNGELLNLHVPKSNKTILYTVKLVGNYMQLTGEDGRTHLFRKMG